MLVQQFLGRLTAQRGLRIEGQLPYDQLPPSALAVSEVTRISFLRHGSMIGERMFDRQVQMASPPHRLVGAVGEL